MWHTRAVKVTKLRRIFVFVHFHNRFGIVYTEVYTEVPT